MLSFACLTVNKARYLQLGQGSYAVILLVLLLGSLKIAKFSGVSVHCNFSSFLSALYVYYFRISCPYIISRDSLRGLGTRLMGLQNQDVVRFMAGLAIARGVVGLIVETIGPPDKCCISALGLLFLGPF